MTKKKTYRKPKIIYQKGIETLAMICSSAKLPQGNCRTPDDGCANSYN